MNGVSDIYCLFANDECNVSEGLHVFHQLGYKAEIVDGVDVQQRVSE